MPLWIERHSLMCRIDSHSFTQQRQRHPYQRPSWSQNKLCGLKKMRLSDCYWSCVMPIWHKTICIYKLYTVWISKNKWLKKKTRKKSTKHTNLFWFFSGVFERRKMWIFLFLISNSFKWTCLMFLLLIAVCAIKIHKVSIQLRKLF